MNSDNLVFLLAMGLFVAAVARLVYRGAIFSPQFLVAMTLLVMGVLNLMPQLIFSVQRTYVLSNTTQTFVALVAASFLATTWFVKRPALEDEYSRVRWKFLSRRTWLILFCTVCVLDPCVSYVSYGAIGLVQGNQTMGTGGGDRSDVMTPLTYVAWSSAAMAAAMLLTDFLFSFVGFGAYLRRRWPDIGLVLLCMLCTVLSGNRFVLIVQFLTVMLGMAMFSRLRLWMPTVAAVFLAVFFVLVGNYRSGKFNIVDKLEHTTGIDAIDMPTAWVSTYLEPNFPNLDNFLQQPPPTMWGLDWLTSVSPSGVVDALGLVRTNSADYLGTNELYAYHGLTFRTMYPDLLMDFGYKGALILGALFFMLAVRTYNQALRSPYYFVIFVSYAPLLLGCPLLAGFYQLPNLLSFALILLIRKDRAVKHTEDDEMQPEDADAAEPGMEHEPEMVHEPEHARSILPRTGGDFSPSH